MKKNASIVVNEPTPPLLQILTFLGAQFKTTQAVQMHMVDKQHCSMNEADFEPFVPFYNFQLSIKDRALRF